MSPNPFMVATVCAFNNQKKHQEGLLKFLECGLLENYFSEDHIVFIIKKYSDNVSDLDVSSNFFKKIFDHCINYKDSAYTEAGMIKFVKAIKKETGRVPKKEKSEHLEGILGFFQWGILEKNISESQIKYILKQYPYDSFSTEWNRWPFCEILKRCTDIINSYSKRKHKKFINFIEKYLGEDPYRNIQIPFDEEVKLKFSRGVYCFTGTFNFGSRSKCEKVIGLIIGHFARKSRDFF